MKIAILYICTGKYDIFWKDFYESSEKHFLKDHQKTYFIFTDSDQINQENIDYVKVQYQESLEWPGNTLFRFRMFMRIIDQLKNFDYIFFLNANALFVSDVGEEILPDTNKGLIVTLHPGFYDKPRKAFTYDTNQESLAYISPDEGDVYVCGGFNGGSSKEYIEMIETLNSRIDEDYEKGVIALWHDESHINRYIIGKDYKLLPAAYMSPEEMSMPFEVKIIVRDKTKYGGHDFLRGQKTSLFKKIINRGKKIIKKVLKKA